jgi:agmatinase
MQESLVVELGLFVYKLNHSTKSKKSIGMLIMSYNPTIFGTESTQKNSQIWLLPVPWEVTTSYGSGTSNGPQAILDASPQIDLFDSDFSEAYKAGYFLFDENKKIRLNNNKLKKVAQKIIKQYEATGGKKVSPKLLKQVNAGSQQMVDTVYDWSKESLKQNRIPAVIGGDHSTPLGLIKALSEKHNDLGVLHIDAHADLRNSYQGFIHSHASIMRNVCELKKAPQKLVQVAIRDYCKEEYDYIQSKPKQIKTFFDRQLKANAFSGKSWDDICKDIVRELPKKVYVSFDIDGLSPEFCPHTGTPVPGGLTFDQANHLLSILVKEKHHIVGFDLNEVAPGPDSEWDGNVGSRVLFKLCGWTITSQKNQS